jgi:hypothetical protein
MDGPTITPGASPAPATTPHPPKRRVQSIIDTARGGQIDAAAGALRDAVVNRNLLDGTLPSWVDLDAVNWTELVQTWAADAP